MQLQAIAHSFFGNTNLLCGLLVGDFSQDAVFRHKFIVFDVEFTEKFLAWVEGATGIKF